MKHLLLLLLSLFALLSGCKSNLAEPPASRADLLLAKKWRVTAQTNTYSTPQLNNGVPVVTDIYAAFYSLPCAQDNFIQFYADKTVVFDEGATKCAATDPQTETSNWAFNADQTKLTLADPTQGGNAVPFDVLELSATTLRLRYTVVTTGTIVVTSINDLTLTAF